MSRKIGQFLASVSLLGEELVRRPFIERFLYVPTLAADKVTLIDSSAGTAGATIAALADVATSGGNTYADSVINTKLAILRNWAASFVVAINGKSTGGSFKLEGTNAVDTCAVAELVVGGVVLTTTTTSADQCDLTPTNWASFNTNSSPGFLTAIKTPASIVSVILFAGLKLTNDPTVATNDDQAYFRYQDTANANWVAVYSIAGVDYTVDTGIPVIASTEYVLEIEVDANRNVSFYVNGFKVAQGGAVLTANIALIPFVGVRTATTAAKAITVRSVHGAVSVPLSQFLPVN